MWSIRRRIRRGSTRIRRDAKNLSSILMGCDNLRAMRLRLLALLTFPLAAQTPSFEVASIRPSKSLVSNSSLCANLKLSPDSVLAFEVHRLDGFIRDAYGNVVEDFDLPEWLRNNGTFAVSVKIPPNTSADTCREMLRNLLAERFHLVADVETRELPRYFVKVAKSGLKLKPVDGPPANLNAAIDRGLENDFTRWTFHGAPASSIQARPVLAIRIPGGCAGETTRSCSGTQESARQSPGFPLL